MDDRPIGVFDSGLGGLTVLGEALHALPNEWFMYLCTPDKVPLGGRPENDAAAVVADAAQRLVVRGCKAVLLASNSATAAAAESLRDELKVPVVAMEPALKPAVQRCHGPIGVMATSLTLSGRKFESLMGQWATAADVRCLACDPLVELTEDPALWDTEVPRYLTAMLAPWRKDPIATVVLGCTHFVLVKRQIAGALPAGTTLMDGNGGTVRQLVRVLKSQDLLSGAPTEDPRVEFHPPGRRRVMEDVLSGLLIGAEAGKPTEQAGWGEQAGDWRL